MGPTMHDVARVAGVSIKTVSNVINDYPHVRPGTRDRVNEAIEQLDYRPNLSARGLRSGRTGVIGLAVPSLRENYFAELADAVIRAAEKRGLGVMVEQTSGQRDGELLAVSTSRPRFLDGLLFSPVSLEPSLPAGFAAPASQRAAVSMSPGAAPPSIPIVSLPRPRGAKFERIVYMARNGALDR